MRSEVGKRLKVKYHISARDSLKGGFFLVGVITVWKVSGDGQKPSYGGKGVFEGYLYSMKTFLLTAERRARDEVLLRKSRPAESRKLAYDRVTNN